MLFVGIRHHGLEIHPIVGRLRTDQAEGS
jgi:hypothetical protein